MATKEELTDALPAEERVRTAAFSRGVSTTLVFARLGVGRPAWLDGLKVGASTRAARASGIPRRQDAGRLPGDLSDCSIG